MKWTEKYNKAITFSYDDGVLQDKRLVEILNRYGIKCTFNINSGMGKENGAFRKKTVEVERYNVSDLKSIYEGHEVAVHTLTHPHLTNLSISEIEYEVLEDKKNIERIFECKVHGMAYPYGDYDDQVIDILEDMNFQYARTVESSYGFDFQDNLLKFQPTCHHNDKQLPELVREFMNMKTKKPQILYIWGHSYEFDVDDNWEKFEALCKQISGHNDIFYGTNKEVLLI